MWKDMLDHQIFKIALRIAVLYHYRLNYSRVRDDF